MELVVSIGNGIVTANNTESVQSMGWDVLVNQLIATSTDTEDVHSLLRTYHELIYTACSYRIIITIS